MTTSEYAAQQAELERWRETMVTMSDDELWKAEKFYRHAWHAKVQLLKEVQRDEVGLGWCVLAFVEERRKREAAVKEGLTDAA